MTTERERDYCLYFDLISINCCDCYEDYWKNLRKSEESFKEFDYSIEKKKHFANFFLKKKLCFIVVLIVFKKSFLIIEMIFRLSMSVIIFDLVNIINTGQRNIAVLLIF